MQNKVHLVRCFRRWFCLLLVGAVFLSQTAVAAYVCTSHPCLVSKAKQTKLEDAGLCHAACYDAEQVAQEITPQASHTVIAHQTYPAAPMVVQPSIHEFSVEPVDLKTKAPPRAVLFCCYRN